MARSLPLIDDRDHDGAPRAIFIGRDVDPGTPMATCWSVFVPLHLGLAAAQRGATCAEIPSAAGYGNARSVAAVQSAVACGGEVHGTRLLSTALCERAREEQYRGIDQILGSSARYGMGYRIFEPAVGWGGWGGSIVMVDLDARMTVAYTMNQMLQGHSGDYRGLGIVLAAYEARGG